MSHVPGFNPIFIIHERQARPRAPEPRHPDAPPGIAASQRKPALQTSCKGKVIRNFQCMLRPSFPLAFSSFLYPLLHLPLAVNKKNSRYPRQRGLNTHMPFRPSHPPLTQTQGESSYPSNPPRPYHPRSPLPVSAYPQETDLLNCAATEGQGQARSRFAWGTEGGEEKQPHKTWELPLPSGCMRRIEAVPSHPALDLGRDTSELGWYRGCGRRPGADLHGRHPLHSTDPYIPHETRRDLCIFSSAQRPSPTRPGPARPASPRRPILPCPIMRAAAEPQPHQVRGLQRPAPLSPLPTSPISPPSH